MLHGELRLNGEVVVDGGVELRGGQTDREANFALCSLPTPSLPSVPPVSMHVKSFRFEDLS